jgi:hypothetical protein
MTPFARMVAAQVLIGVVDSSIHEDYKQRASGSSGE